MATNVLRGENSLYFLLLWRERICTIRMLPKNKRLHCNKEGYFLQYVEHVQFK